MWVSYQFHNTLIKNAIDELEHDASLVKIRFESRIKSISQDLMFLQDTPPMMGIYRSLKNGKVDPLDQSSLALWEERLTTIFEAMCSSKHSYQQIRLIQADNIGLELVRVDRLGEDGKVRVVPQNQLQAKGNRQYVIDALKHPAGKMVLSTINLNQEYDQVIAPYVPVLRASVLINDPQGKPFVLLIINQDLRRVFNDMKSLVTPGNQFILANNKGGFLIHPDSNFEFRIDQKLCTQYPELEPILRQSEDPVSNAIVNDSIDKNKTAIAISRFWPQPEIKTHYIDICITKPYGLIVSAMAPVRHQIIAVMSGVLFLALFVGVYFSQSFTRPLLQIIDAIDSYGKGETQSINVLKCPSDETGVLLSAFQNMVFQVEKRNNELRFSEARNRAVLNAAADAILTIDDMGIIQEANAATEQLFCYEAVELIGQKIELLMPPQYGKEHDGYLAKLCSRESDSTPPIEGIIGRIREISGQRKDGSVFPMELSVSRVLINNRQFFTGIIRDVTERKQAEERMLAYNEELRQKNMEAEQFTYSVSHDLKSPLVSCTGLMALVWEDLENDDLPAVRDSLTRIDRNVKRMEACINELLEFCRIGRIRHEPQLIDMDRTIAQVVTDLEPLILQDHVDVQVSPNLPSVYADPVRVSELFGNLITNALKYGCKGNDHKKIEIGGACVENEIRYYVRDYGNGIDPNYHQKIFGLFQRLSNDKQGSGVGLAIVSRIMEVHHGRVWVESDVGQGATFWLAFSAKRVEKI